MDYSYISFLTFTEIKSQKMEKMEKQLMTNIFNRSIRVVAILFTIIMMIIDKQRIDKPLKMESVTTKRVVPKHDMFSRCFAPGILRIFLIKFTYFQVFWQITVLCKKVFKSSKKSFKISLLTRLPGRFLRCFT